MKIYIGLSFFTYMKVKDLMGQPSIIEKDVNLVEAAKLMSSKGIGSLIFVLKNKAKGILTEGDLVKNFGKHKKISGVMSKNMLSITPEETIDSALQIMNENKIKRLPVIDEKKRLVGIISIMHIASCVDKLEGEFILN